jgi:Fur family transcriptional regulator, ferric uptake regulator
MRPTDILHYHNLKRTSCREGIIGVIMSTNKALSENEIRERLQGRYDRTTFYRSFQTLEEHKILHKIVVDSQIVKYALGHPAGNTHVHFFCTECQAVKCLDSVNVQRTSLPEGYSDTETEVLIKGRCTSCNNPGGRL